MRFSLANNNYFERHKNATIYTPPAVSDFLYKVVRSVSGDKGIILDPCVGKGSLLRPFKDGGFTVVGVDIEDQGFLNTHVKNYLEVKKGEIDQPLLVVMNPPFNLDDKNRQYVKDHCKGRPLLPELFFKKSLELFGNAVPIAMIAPCGFRNSLSKNSKRLSKFTDGTYPAIDSVISLPVNIFDGVEVNSEILFFNMKTLSSFVKLNPHYFYGSANQIGASVDEKTTISYHFGKSSPFVKWVGGKRRLSHKLLSLMPKHINRYYEMFVGGGAVLFDLLNQRRIDQAFISDINKELLTSYNVIKSDVEGLIKQLKDHAHHHEHSSDGEYFKLVRDQNPVDSVSVASRFIYLNKTCFNGLYRVSKAGKFNVPRGQQKKYNICDEHLLWEAHAALRDVSTHQGDFDYPISVGLGDVVYCDPPYDGMFNAYSQNGFTQADQVRLRDKADEWISKGAIVVITNADTAFIRNLYKDRSSYALFEQDSLNSINPTLLKLNKNRSELLIVG